MRDLIGHGRLAAKLAQRAAQGGLAHAYVLSGPRSIGKRTVAIRLAQTLNCETGAPGGCGSCLSCQKIERGTHPDVLTVTRLVDRGAKGDDAKGITIEQIREMQHDLALRPIEGRRRVVIIDDAADLSEHAEVALLKTLEEPPAHALLLLLTPQPARLLPTIRSRAQLLELRLVPAGEIVAGIVARFGAAAAGHAAGAAGRPGIAIRIASDAGARAERDALDSELYDLIGARLTERFAWAAGLADESDTQRRARAIDARLTHWSELLRDAALVARGAAGRALRADRAAQSAALARTIPARALVDTLLLMERFRDDLRDNANARAMLELLALKLPRSEAVKGAMT